MLGKAMAACCGVLVLTTLAPAQAPRFRWQSGQVMLYRTEHNTANSFVVGEDKGETKTRVQSIKRWQVMDVDSAGVATLQMSLQALFFETTTPSGEQFVFDSAHPDKNTPELRKQYDYIGQPLVVLRIDGQGKVIEVKEARPEYSAAKYESDPAFKLLLPAEPLKAGLSWEHNYQMVLGPPYGTGDEKYAAVKRYTCKDVAGSLATINLTTEMKSAPAAQEDQVPLWQMMPEGEVVFDVEAGRLQKATLRIDKEGKIEGGATRFQSVYTEQYIGDR